MARQTNDHFNRVVYDAAKQGNVDDLVAALASHSHLVDTPKPYEVQQTPLYAAAMNGHAPVIEKLIALGSRAIDVPNRDGWTPLLIAAKRGPVVVIELLVRLGSNAIDIPDQEGCTPLFEAASFGHENAIELLVRMGGRAIDTPNNAGKTPMSIAASRAIKGCSYEEELARRARVITTLKCLGGNTNTRRAL